MSNHENPGLRIAAVSRDRGVAEQRMPHLPFRASIQAECSLVIPAYREAKRLPPYLDAVRQYLSEQYGYGYEVLVVDDGSDDGLPDILDEMSEDWPELRVLRHAVNQGKGAAVRTGMLQASGKRLLFADADGATPIDEERKLRLAIDAGADIAIGSRRAKSDDAKRDRRFTRCLGSWAFSRLVRSYVSLPVRDTQCGFKMFRREAGLRLFTLCDEKGYLFDVFLLRLAAHLGYQVREVDVNWQEIAGSKLNPAVEFFRMWQRLSRLERRIDNALKTECDPHTIALPQREGRLVRKAA